MGQQESIPHQEPHSARHYHLQARSNPMERVRVEHEGILKLRPTPFPDCVEIDNNGSPLFLENAQMTLQDLIQSRLYTNRLFPIEDMEHLIEHTTYTLAHLFEAGVVYKDMATHNIYYNKGVFKLLPNDLIGDNIYERAYDQFYGNQEPEQGEEFVCLSPELIIALRMHEKRIEDDDIFHKSNVFMFGLILLEATTLMPSSECYDPATYDIFNNIVSERLELVEDHYNDKIASFIGNMIDYDYTERMDWKQLAIWVSRELVEQQPVNPRLASRSSQSKFSSANKSRIFKKEEPKVNCSLKGNPHMMSQGDDNEEVLSDQDTPQQVEQYQIPVKRSYSRTNMIYINNYEDGGLKNEESHSNLDYHRGNNAARNQVYLKRAPDDEQSRQCRYDRNVQKQFKKNKNPQQQQQTYNNRQPVNNRQKFYQEEQQQQTPVYPRTNTYNYSEMNFDHSYGKLPYDQQRTKSHHQDYDDNPYLAKNNPSYHNKSASSQYGNNNNNASPHNKAVPSSRSGTSFNDAIISDEGGTNYVNKFREIGNIGNFKPNKQNDYEKGKFQQYEEQGAMKTTAKGQKQTNKYYPSLSDIENHQQTETKRLAKHAQIKGSRASVQGKDGFESNQSKNSDGRGSNYSMNDGSINRMKMEVQKSRKMIEEFRKSEGLIN